MNPPKLNLPLNNTIRMILVFDMPIEGESNYGTYSVHIAKINGN